MARQLHHLTGNRADPAEQTIRRRGRRAAQSDEPVIAGNPSLDLSLGCSLSQGAKKGAFAAGTANLPERPARFPDAAQKGQRMLDREYLAEGCADTWEDMNMV